MKFRLDISGHGREVNERENRGVSSSAPFLIYYHLRAEQATGSWDENDETETHTSDFTSENVVPGFLRTKSRAAPLLIHSDTSIGYPVTAQNVYPNSLKMFLWPNLSHTETSFSKNCLVRESINDRSRDASLENTHMFESERGVVRGETKSFDCNHFILSSYETMALEQVMI